ncbi:C-type lectin domain family 4 member M-like [Anabas testudineus]|uniref:C-type lectin domain family 4 member M-like n=1 Tax=Anabas testudineus TaxID=64144 RepID=UPI000E4553E2|nr:C-type lectin domain family 4 member M-like [Anabas testudineus]
MDATDIYANVEEPSGGHSKWKREMNRSTNIYENKDACCAVEQNRVGPALSDVARSKTVKTSSCRAAAVILGLLCLLLLVGLITLGFLHKDRTELEMEMVQLQTSHKNLTKENDQLQTSFRNLTKENDQLQTSFRNLTKENDQLQTSFKNLTKENDQLQTSFKNLTKENDQLQTSYSILTKDRDQLQKILEKRIDEQNNPQVLYSEVWRHFNGNFYYFSSLMKSWQESRNDCQQRGADLVIINSAKEQDFIRSWRKHMWIGLNDREVEGTWRWVDGTPVLTATRFWGTSEPNDAKGTEDCAEIYNYESQNSWNDAPCEIQKHWICESRLK